MDAVKFIKERNRMCHSFENCNGCPLLHENCDNYIDVRIELVVQAVEEWSAAHPCKTRQSVFLEQWPDTQITKNGDIVICPKQLCKGEELSKLIAACRGTNCDSCRNKFWGKVVR